MGDQLEPQRAVPVERLAELTARVMLAFSPSAPIDRQDLFSGRRQQMDDLVEVIFQRGQHAMLYGERGVGKTSLAKVMSEIYRGRLLTASVNCDGTDDFSKLWRKVLEEIHVARRVAPLGFAAEAEQIFASANELLPSGGEIRPNDVRVLLQALSGAKPVVVVIDEFDRLEHSESRRLFADTIKMLSDHSVDATTVLVGVADSVDELIAEHASVGRALVQIRMPRMSPEELAEIVTRGLARAEMTIEASARARIGRLSHGLPHYAHLLAQAAARAALAGARTVVSSGDVDAAISRVLERAQQSIINAYHRATQSSRETLYPQVLLACALAKRDDLGSFSAPDVRGPLSAIMGKKYDIPAFSPHLHAFSDEPRGRVLQKLGAKHRFRFRFDDPLLQPYVVLRGLSEGMVDKQTLEKFTGDS